MVFYLLQTSIEVYKRRNISQNRTTNNLSAEKVKDLLLKTNTGDTF